MFTRMLARAVAVLLAVTVVLITGSATASATADRGWRIRNGIACVETHDWKRWPAVEAAHRWDAAPYVRVTARASCADLPRGNRIVMRAYRDSTVGACAWVQPGPLHSGRYVSSVTLWLNIAPAALRRCASTAGQRAHVISWGIGSALGLTRSLIGAGPSCVTSWAPWPTAADVRRLGQLYSTIVVVGW